MKYHLPHLYIYEIRTIGAVVGDYNIVDTRLETTYEIQPSTAIVCYGHVDKCTFGTISSLQNPLSAPIVGEA